MCIFSGKIYVYTLFDSGVSIKFLACVINVDIFYKKNYILITEINLCLTNLHKWTSTAIPITSQKSKLGIFVLRINVKIFLSMF